METILDWAERLERSGKTVIVEGPKDKRALEELGVSKIVMLHRRPVYSIVEYIAEHDKRAVILTDLDKEGRRLYGILSGALQMHGVQVDNKFREWLQKNSKVKNIEGLKC
jgi:5S rRNA maturation endonuclease (ribonuclease M5)